MKVLITGHEYELESMYGGPAQVLTFITKGVKEGEGKFVTLKDGTTNEEVLAVLIDRLQTLQEIGYCKENSIVITKLEESLMWLNKRTEDRLSRGVEGTPEK